MLLYNVCAGAACCRTVIRSLWTGKIVAGGLTIFLTGTIISGLSDSLEMMLFGRIVQASGVCAASVLARAISRDLFDGEKLARALSLTMIATATAPGFSPLVGSLITVTLGWRSIFILVSLMALTVGIFYIRTLGETHPASRRVSRSFTGVLKAYISLTLSGTFIFPALAVSLLMSGCRWAAFRTFMYVLKQPAIMVLLSLPFFTKRI